MTKLPDQILKAWENIEGPVVLSTVGAIFNHMKTWNPVKHPGHAAAVLRCHECYCGSDRIK